jgi:hypothetical protein
MPRVHPNAATMLDRRPRERPVASVYRTPVPGDTTTTSDVTRKPVLTSLSVVLHAAIVVAVLWE